MRAIIEEYFIMKQKTERASRKGDVLTSILCAISAYSASLR